MHFNGRGVFARLMVFYMPLGIVSDEEFLKQAGLIGPTPHEDNKEPEVRASIEKLITPGRTEGKPNTPNVVRKFIAEEAINGASPKVLSEAMQISPSSISAYKVGAHSTTTYNEPNENLKRSTDSIREALASKARNRLRSALNGLTPDKLVDCKARDLAGIAKDMSAVIKNIEPSRDNDGPNVNFVFYSPKLRREDDFSIISVNE